MLKCKIYTGKETVTRAQIKIDGHRVRVEVGEDTFAVYTSVGHNIAHQLSEYSWYINLISKMVPMSAVEGEIYMPGQTSSAIKTALKNSDLDLQFCAFAVPVWGHRSRINKSVIWSEDLLESMGIEHAEGRDPNFDYQAEAERLDIEGWVFKEYNYAGWYKWKREKTIDVYITGYYYGKGKYVGLVGALSCNIWVGDRFIEIAKASGMTDQERFEWIWTDRIVGKCVEITYQNVGSKGRLRHPRFLRIREDKNGVDCTPDQDLELEKFYATRRKDK